MVPAELKYNETHEWIRILNDSAQVGITDFAQQELHEIVYVELPRPGQTVKKGDEIAAIESVKARSEIYSPLSGVISQINDSLIDNGEPSRPEMINEDPYGKGWLVEIELEIADEVRNLLSAEDYMKLIDRNK